MSAAYYFKLESLSRYCCARLSATVNGTNVVALYQLAAKYAAHYLAEYIHGYLLQNFVQLLSNNDSVRQLLFGTGFSSINQERDLIGQLLRTLQERIKDKNHVARSGHNRMARNYSVF